MSESTKWWIGVIVDVAAVLAASFSVLYACTANSKSEDANDIAVTANALAETANVRAATADAQAASAQARANSIAETANTLAAENNNISNRVAELEEANATLEAAGALPQLGFYCVLGTSKDLSEDFSNIVAIDDREGGVIRTDYMLDQPELADEGQRYAFVFIVNIGGDANQVRISRPIWNSNVTKRTDILETGNNENTIVIQELTKGNFRSILFDVIEATDGQSCIQAYSQTGITCISFLVQYTFRSFTSTSAATRQVVPLSDSVGEDECGSASDPINTEIVMQPPVEWNIIDLEQLLENVNTTETFDNDGPIDIPSEPMNPSNP